MLYKPFFKNYALMNLKARIEKKQEQKVINFIKMVAGAIIMVAFFYFLAMFIYIIS